MSNPAPAFLLYANDWLSSPRVALMTPAEEGAYIRLLCYAWNDPDCSLPDDDHALAQLSRLGEAWFKASSTTLEPSSEALVQGASSRIRKCFVPHPEKPGRLINLRLLEERQKREAWVEKSKIGGKNSARSRVSGSKNGSTIVEPRDTGVVQGCSNISSSSSLSIEEKIARPPSAVRASTPKRSINLVDEAFISELKANPGYAGIDIDRELAKIDAWLLTPRGRGKKKTCQRVLNWLNRVEQPLTITSGPSGRLTCVNRVIPTGGKFFKNCGKPVSLGQPNKNHPLCDECLAMAPAHQNGKVHV